MGTQATLIGNARRFRRLTSDHLKKIGVVMKRAKYFITCGELTAQCVADVSPEYVRSQLTAVQRKPAVNPLQLTLDFGDR